MGRPLLNLVDGELKRLDAAAETPIPTLRDFLAGAWNNVLHPAEPLNLDGAWYVDLVCQELTLQSIGTLKRLGHTELANQLLTPYGLTIDLLPEELTQKKNLLINIPPRCTKTTLVTICWPCWEWLFMGWLPDLCLSYGQNLASEHNDDRRKVIESDWFKAFNRRLTLSRSLNRITEFENEKRGKMVGRGLNSGVTGGGGNRIIFDDPNDPNTVESDPVRERTARGFLDYSTTRRNNPAICVIVVVQQRTHDQDVSGIILREPDDWRVIIIQMEAEKHTQMVMPLSGTVIDRPPGDIMHPSRFTEEVIKGLKRQPSIWAGRYQQHPDVTGGGMFQLANWRLYAELPKLTQSVISCDATFKDTPDSDYVAIGVISQRRNARYVLGPDNKKIAEHQYFLRHVRRGQMDIIKTESNILQVVQEYPMATTNLIEDKANGPAIISRLNTVVPGLQAFSPGKSSKMERAASIQPIQHRGDVLVPIAEVHRAAFLEMGVESISIKEWWDIFPPPSTTTAEFAPVEPSVKEFLNELALFPVGANDDQVDMLSMALLWLEQNKVRGGGSGFVSVDE